MRKTIIFLLGIAGIALFYFTFVSAARVFRSDWQLPQPTREKPAHYRLILITQELETPFWVRVGDGALEEAGELGASIEIWGSYSKNQEDFLKKIEIAIDSKVDGIIVQGLDTEEFRQLTKVKAAFYGIPIVTVAYDVPMADSLRRTYVGSNQHLAGQLIARQLISDMGTAGKVVLLGDSRREFYQQQRLRGILDALRDYPDVRTEYAETSEARDQVIAATKDVMNRMPDVQAFVAVNANTAAAMIQEIGRRSRVEPYHIYSFDDSQEAMSLLRQGKLDGMIEQSPEAMGRISVSRMIEWLGGQTVPLDTEGYFTEIRMLRAVDAR